MDLPDVARPVTGIIDGAMDRSLVLGYTRIGSGLRRRWWPAGPAPDAMVGKRVVVTGATAAVATTALVVPLVTQNTATPSAVKPLVSNGMQPAAGAPLGAYLKIDTNNVVTVIIGSTVKVIQA